MSTFIKHIGPFGILQVIIAILLLIHSVKKIIALFFVKEKKINSSEKYSINSILVWSSYINILGILGSLFVFYSVILSINHAKVYDLEIIISAFPFILPPIISGMTIFSFFFIVWFILWRRYNKQTKVNI